MEVKQIYGIVNEAAAQSIGSDAIKAIDTNSFVALGQQVLSSNDNVEGFNNTLVMRIARTVISFRKYQSRLKPIVFDDIRWGGIAQKIKAEMPEAVEDDAYELVDGESIDMYVIRKPKFSQKFFVNTTPYSFFATIQRFQLKRAFLSPEKFGAFLAALYGEIQNKIDLTFENLGYLTMGNYMANAKDTQIINLVTKYNTESNENVTPGPGALFNPAFLRYAVAQMNLYSLRMEDMSKLYNDGTETRHTPKKYQIFAAVADFVEYMRTVVQWEAFHSEYVEKKTSIVVPRWQSPDKPMSIKVTDSAGTEKNIDNIVGFIYDRDALGVYRKEQEVLTTPVNARGRYTNTFYHEEHMWFNDMSENGLIFTLN